MGLISLSNAQKIKGLLDVKSQQPVKGLYYSDGKGNASLIYRAVHWNVRKEWTYTFTEVADHGGAYAIAVGDSFFYVSRINRFQKFSLDGKLLSESPIDDSGTFQNFLIAPKSVASNDIGFCCMYSTDFVPQKSYAVRQFGPEGDLVWSHVEDGLIPVETRHSTSMVTDLEGNVFVLTYDKDDNTAQFIAKYSSVGELKWQLKVEFNADYPDPVYKNKDFTTIRFSVNKSGLLYVYARTNQSKDNGTFMIYDKNANKISTLDIQQKIDDFFLDEETDSILINGSSSKTIYSNVVSIDSRGNIIKEKDTALYFSAEKYANQNGIYCADINSSSEIDKYAKDGNSLYKYVTDEKYDMTKIAFVPDGFILTSQEKGNYHITKYTEYEEGAS